MEKKEKKEKRQSSLKVGAAASVQVADSTSKTTAMYNKECDGYRQMLGQKKQACQAALNRKLEVNPDYVGDRPKAVNGAWEYEAKVIKIGGKGTVDWTPEQLLEIEATGKVRGVEGHHINSVAENPSMQADPNNIEFCLDRKEHLKKHNGNFQNPTTGPLIDRDKMLVNANNRRVLKNEVKGLGVAVGFGVVEGICSSVINECKENGWNMNSVKNGLKKCGKPVLRSGIVCGVSYIIARGVNLFN